MIYSLGAGAVSDRSRSERGADPDGLAASEHSYAPTSIVPSEAANMDLLMIEPPATSTDLVRLGEPKANETPSPTVPMQTDRLGEPSVTLNAEQKNMLVNAYDQRQVHLHQQAVYVSQDKGPIVASEAREAISELESQAQQRHEKAMRESKKEVEDMAQQRLRMAESAIAEQAEEAFRNRGTITQLQHAEIQEVNKLRTELHSAQVLKEEMQIEGAKKFSLYDSRLDDMKNLVNELKATNERQRVDYESQLHRYQSIIAAHQPPIRIPSNEPVSKANRPGKSIDDFNLSSEEMIPEAPGLPKRGQDRGRSRERVAKSTNAAKGEKSPQDPDPPSPPHSSSSESSESSEGLDKKKIAKMIKKQLSKIGGTGKSESSHGLRKLIESLYLSFQIQRRIATGEFGSVMLSLQLRRSRTQLSSGLNVFGKSPWP